MTVSRPLNTKYRIKLKIADIIIELKSCIRMRPLNRKCIWRYKNFIYQDKKNPEIRLDIEANPKEPLLQNENKIFTSTHPLSSDTYWSLYKNGKKYVIRKSVSSKKQYAIFNQDFSKGTIFLLSEKKDMTWSTEDIIYDILQIILINYLSKRDGIFIHSMGLKDIDKSGLLFVGPSQSGKSTTARLWHKHSRAKVLNDDRVVIRKIKDRFYIFGTPWHGDFSDYLKSSPDKAELKNIFYIYHHTKNKLRNIKPKKKFGYLYPNIFPTFWNKETLEQQINLCQELISAIPFFTLGFKKNKSVISVVRSAKEMNSNIL